MKNMAANRKSLFVSSVQKELQPERRAVKDFVEGDALLRRFFEVFLETTMDLKTPTVFPRPNESLTLPPPTAKPA